MSVDRFTSTIPGRAAAGHAPGSAHLVRERLSPIAKPAEYAEVYLASSGNWSSAPRGRSETWSSRLSSAGWVVGGSVLVIVLVLGLAVLSRGPEASHAPAPQPTLSLESLAPPTPQAEDTPRARAEVAELGPLAEVGPAVTPAVLGPSSDQRPGPRLPLEPGCVQNGWSSAVYGSAFPICAGAAPEPTLTSTDSKKKALNQGGQSQSR